MVDANEEVSLTLKREFNEEALNSLEGDQKEQVKKDIQETFKNGKVVSVILQIYVMLDVILIFSCPVLFQFERNLLNIHVVFKARC